MKKIRLLVADDHAIVRDGLRMVFKSDPHFTIVGEATNGDEAVRLAETRQPDVAILDISMPVLNGIEAAKKIRELAPETRILILTVHQNQEYIHDMILAGANGYLLKNAERKEIFAAVRAVSLGDPFFSPGVSKVLMEGIIKRAGNGQTQNLKEKDLTRREVEILRYVAEGMSSPEIAAKLYLSVSTVNSHRTNIMKKLNIHDTARLVRYAIQTNIVSVAPDR